MQRKLWSIGAAAILVLGSLACNLPFLSPAPAAAPAASPGPTDAGFQAPTQPAAPGETPPATQASAPPAAETTPAGGAGAGGADKRLTLATTDSLDGSGLLAVLVDGFQRSTGYEVKLELGGVGRALRLGEKSIADVLLVDNPGNEVAFMKAGHGRDRVLVFHADYVIVGPADDPAGVKGAAGAADAFKKIAGAQAKFVTRGADSDVVRLEKRLWEEAGITPAGDWYITATDAGLVGTLKLASDKKAYTLSDRKTFLENQAKFPLTLLSEGDVELRDPYHVITGNPDKSTKINYAAAQAFVAYLSSPEVQAMIAAFGADTLGQPIYFADAGKPEP